MPGQRSPDQVSPRSSHGNLTGDMQNQIDQNKEKGSFQRDVAVGFGRSASWSGLVLKRTSFFHSGAKSEENGQPARRRNSSPGGRRNSSSGMVVSRRARCYDEKVQRLREASYSRTTSMKRLQSPSRAQALEPVNKFDPAEIFDIRAQSSEQQPSRVQSSHCDQGSSSLVSERGMPTWIQNECVNNIIPSQVAQAPPVSSAVLLGPAQVSQAEAQPNLEAVDPFLLATETASRSRLQTKNMERSTCDPSYIMDWSSLLCACSPRKARSPPAESQAAA